MSATALAIDAETPRPNPRPLGGAVILIGEAGADPGGAMRALFREQGASQVIWRRSMAAVEEVIDNGGIACALIDVGLPDGDVIDLTRRIRFGEIGDNPFLPILITTSSSEGRVVLAALLAGVDDVLTKPLSASVCAGRMHRLAIARKPFVAASGYLGPERAQMGRAFRDARRFVAPNALKLALSGQPLDMLATDPEFVEARNRLTVLRLERCARLFAAAGRGLLHAESDAERQEHSGDLVAQGETLRALAREVPEGNLKDVARRLTVLAPIAAGDEADDAETQDRAVRLVVEIADAIANVIARQDDDMFAFPADITRRMDKRFPGLAAAA